MAALTITAANLIPVTTSANYSTHTNLAAVDITQGQTVYLLTDNTVGLCDANGTSPSYVYRGLAISSAKAGAPLLWQVGGDVDFGAILTTATIYIAGATAGAIKPISDLASGWYLSIVGYAISTSRMRLLTTYTGVSL